MEYLFEMNGKLLILSLFFSLFSLIMPSFQAAEARVMCCPVKDKCAPKADKCSPQAQCQPKDKCGPCPDGLIETRKWWPW
jgi:hypothetical protein